MKTLLHFLAPLFLSLGISLAPAENVISYSHEPGELVSFPNQENSASSESYAPTYVNISLPTLQDQADGSPEEILSRLNSQIENNGYIPIEQRYPDIHFAVKEEDMEEGKMYIDSSEQHTVARMKITDSSPADETDTSSKYAALTHSDVYMVWERKNSSQSEGGVTFNYYLKKVWITYNDYTRETRAHEERHVIDVVGMVSGVKFPSELENLEEGKENKFVYWDSKFKNRGTAALGLPLKWYNDPPKATEADNKSKNLEELNKKLAEAVKGVFAAKEKVKIILEARAQYAEVYYNLQKEKNNINLFSRTVNLLAPADVNEKNIMSSYAKKLVKTNTKAEIQFISTIKKDNKEEQITRNVGITYGEAFKEYFLNEEGEIDRNKVLGDSKNKVEGINDKLKEAKKELVEKLKEFGIAYLNAFPLKDKYELGTGGDPIGIPIDIVRDRLRRVYIDYLSVVSEVAENETEEDVGAIMRNMEIPLREYIEKSVAALSEVNSRVSEMQEAEKKEVEKYIEELTKEANVKNYAGAITLVRWYDMKYCQRTFSSKINELRRLLGLSLFADMEESIMQFFKP